MMIIGNAEQIIQNGETQIDRKARELALKSLEAAIRASDPKSIIKSKVKLKGSILHVDEYAFDLKKFKNIYVIGGGKASGSMAEALEEVLGEKITSGLVNVPKDDKHNTGKIRLHRASHPIPDESGVEGTRKMLKIAEKAGENDLIICLISGGAPVSCQCLEVKSQ
jgi:glycerate 2-kinase